LDLYNSPDGIRNSKNEIISTLGNMDIDILMPCCTCYPFVEKFIKDTLCTQKFLFADIHGVAVSMINNLGKSGGLYRFGDHYQNSDLYLDAI